MLYLFYLGQLYRRQVFFVWERVAMSYRFHQWMPNVSTVWFSIKSLQQILSQNMQNKTRLEQKLSRKMAEE